MYTDWVTKKKKKKKGVKYDSFQVWKMFAYRHITPSHKAQRYLLNCGSELICPLLKGHVFKLILYIKTRFNNN